MQKEVKKRKKKWKKGKGGKKYENAIKKKDVEIEKLQETEAEVKAHVAIVMKEEYDKEIERCEYKQTIKTLKLEHDPALKKLNNPRRMLDVLNLDKCK